MSINKQKLVNNATQVFLPRNSNQAKGIAEFAINFIRDGNGVPSENVLNRLELFHKDSVFCGLSALALKTNAPNVLRNEAFRYKDAQGATVFGSNEKVHVEKAIVANCAAVREWDSNGTVFGYNEKFNHIAGEFGHNDFYPVAVAAAQVKNLDGEQAVRGMLLIDEIRGRFAEVFSLKDYYIDHVVHGGIASAATYGAMVGASAEQIESAIGMLIAHYIPFRAIRAGKQLSDSKGSSAAITTEAAILSVIRSMNGFVGPKDIFRNPESIFRINEKTDGDSPFDLVLTHSGEDFSVMGMHFKLGLYEHQSAGAIQGLVNLLSKDASFVSNLDNIDKIDIVAYQPAFGIIGDPAKKNPKTRQSADHSMVYIISTLIRKAHDLYKKDGALPTDQKELWKKLMLSPLDYTQSAIFDSATRSVMDKIHFIHGGKQYDENYPKGIPTSIKITSGTSVHDSGFIMFPLGHAANTDAYLEEVLGHKFSLMSNFIAPKDSAAILSKLTKPLRNATADEVKAVYDVPIEFTEKDLQL